MPSFCISFQFSFSKPNFKLFKVEFQTWPYFLSFHFFPSSCSRQLSFYNALNYFFILIFSFHLSFTLPLSILSFSLHSSILVSLTCYCSFLSSHCWSFRDHYYWSCYQVISIWSMTTIRTLFSTYTIIARQLRWMSFFFIQSCKVCSISICFHPL